MKRQSAAVLLLCANLMLCAGLTPSNAGAQEKDELATFEEQALALTGTLIKVRMTQSPDNPWEELALKDAKGTLYILIGSAVEQLLPLVGKTVAVQGFSKPPMRIQGTNCTVIEIAKFTLADNQDK
jgi:hypothetical protein